MPSIDDLKIDRPTTTLLKGPTGFGKTIAAASYPEPVYIFDFDGRVDSIFSFYSGERKREIYFDTYGDWNLFRFLDELEHLLDTGSIQVDGVVRYPKTIVIDSVTHLSISAVEYQLSEVRKLQKKKGSKVKETQGGIVIPDWDEFKGETSVFNQVLGDIRALPKRHGINTIATAHPTKGTAVGKSADGKVEVSIRVNPIVAIGGKAADIVPTAFNEVYHFALLSSVNAGERGKRVVYTEATGNEMAKTTMILPTFFEWTNELFYDKLIALAIEGQQNGGVWGTNEEVKKTSGW